MKVCRHCDTPLERGVNWREANARHYENQCDACSRLNWRLSKWRVRAKAAEAALAAQAPPTPVQPSPMVGAAILAAQATVGAVQAWIMQTHSQAIVRDHDSHRAQDFGEVQRLRRSPREWLRTLFQ